MSERHSSGTSPLLARPRLPQAVGGALDVGTLDGEAVQVRIPTYPQCNLGDRLTIVWVQRETGIEVVRRYAHLANASQDFEGGEYEIRIWPLLVLLPGNYDVHYTVTSRTGNGSYSESMPITVSGTPAAPTVITGGVIQSNLFGTYQPGVVGAWIAPDTYVIDPAADDAILVSSLSLYSTGGKSTPNAVLQLYRNDESDPFASLACNAAGTAWKTSVKEVTHFERGDLISIHLVGEQNSMIFLALAI